MKRIIIVLACLNIFIGISHSQTYKVLFLGNSYTAANTLPEKVSKIASSMGDSVFYDSNTPGGYRLLNHATNATTLDKISQEDWDFVVIQAQSQEPSWPPSQVANEVLPYATILNDSIKSNHACTEVVFYMTWGRKYGDQQNCSSWPPVCTFLGMQERLMTGYMTMAEDNGSTVAPVGLAWKQSMDNDPDSLINLYSGDNSHPSLSGTYLTACVMYATIFQKSPVGSNFTAGLSENEVLFLQQMAEDVVIGEDYNFTFFDTYTNINYDLNWQSWFDNGNIAFADFSSIGFGATYNFNDLSLNAENWLWDFGDGNTSSLPGPSHTYLESGEYIVQQGVSNPCFQNEALDTINVVISSADEIFEKDVVTFFPNPGSGIFEIEIDPDINCEKLSYKVYDLKGTIVKNDDVHVTNNKFSGIIDLSTLTEGIYYLQISTDREFITKKLLIN